MPNKISSKSSPTTSTAGSSKAAGPTTASRPQLTLRIDDKQKVHLAGQDSPTTQAKNKNNYVTMGADDFVSFKNGGKRTSSNKVTDPMTQKHYAYDKQTKQFHEFDKTRPGNKGAAVDAKQNAELQTRLDNKQLVDRSRPDRNSTAHELMPGDVGPYAKGVQVSPHTQLGAVSGTQTGFNTNRDHVPSGESLNRRNPGNKEPYSQGMTVAIPDDNLHKPSSLTYGSRQGTKDTIAGQSTTTSRVDHDAQHPASAFNRDMNHLLDKTQGQQLAQGHERPELQQKLDMNNADSRLNLIGAYRYAGRNNVKLNENVGPGRGYDPQSPAHSAQVDQLHPPTSSRKYEKAEFKYTPVPGKTQGELISNDLRNRLVSEGHAQQAQDVTGGSKKRTSDAAGLDGTDASKKPRTEP